MDSDRHDALILFIGSPRGVYELDQVRLTKGIFLLTQESPSDRDLYQFREYDYGPFCSLVYRDIEKLRLLHDVAENVIPDSARRIFSLTSNGKLRYQMLWEEASDLRLQIIEAIKLYVTSVSFVMLLDKMAEDFPSYFSDWSMKRRSIGRGTR